MKGLNSVDHSGKWSNLHRGHFWFTATSYKDREHTDTPPTHDWSRIVCGTKLCAHGVCTYSRQLDETRWLVVVGREDQEPSIYCQILSSRIQDRWAFPSHTCKLDLGTSYHSSIDFAGTPNKMSLNSRMCFLCLRLFACCCIFLFSVYLRKAVINPPNLWGKQKKQDLCLAFIP